MDPISLKTLADWSRGSLTGNPDDILISRISKDSRTLEPGDIYLALGGENFDGNTFLPDAIRRGAAAAITSEQRSQEIPSDFPLIQVRDAQAALHAMATAWRNELDLRAIGVTGSSGKTSTKEFTAAVLATRFQVTKTLGNLNNHIGLPLTILTASLADQTAVWEMGMNHPGEIAPLAALARPDIAIVTNVGVAHIEFFPNRDGIASEKAEILRALGPDGIAIIPDTDDYADFLASQSRARVIRVGIGSGDVQADEIRLDATGSHFRLHAQGSNCQAHLSVTGEHMIRNALLAVAAGMESGLSLEECAEGLSAARLTGGRLQSRMVRGVHLIDDTYNANPDSVEAALKALAALPTSGRHIAILGKMGELGSYAETGYRRVATAAAKHADILITVGEETGLLASQARTSGCRDVQETRDALEAARLLREVSQEGDVVLIKGSRSARMEQVIGGFTD